MWPTSFFEVEPYVEFGYGFAPGWHSLESTNCSSSIQSWQPIPVVPSSVLSHAVAQRLSRLASHISSPLPHHCSSLALSSTSSSRRVPFVGGNWKCYGNTAVVSSLVHDLLEGPLPSTMEIVIFPPFIYAALVRQLVGQSFLKVGVQNISSKSGAFTGETSPEMAIDSGISHVVIGHSERRHVFCESDIVIRDRVLGALTAGLTVTLCVGETDAERQRSETLSVIDRQLRSAVPTFFNNPRVWNSLIVAYEPVWAIGTGKTATPDLAQEVHHFIRSFFKSTIGSDCSNVIRIIYGGSVTKDNSDALIAMPDIDGFLVGGASLKSAEFRSIINSVASTR